MIERVCKEFGATRWGFARELEAVLFPPLGIGPNTELTELREIARRHKPDAFKLDKEQQLLTIYEVVKTHDCNPEDFLILWWFLDCEEWELRLEVWSHHGGRAGLYENRWFIERNYERIRETKEGSE